MCLYFTNTLRWMNERTRTIALLAHSCCYVATCGYRRANGGNSTQALYWDHFIDCFILHPGCWSWGSIKQLKHNLVLTHTTPTDHLLSRFVKLWEWRENEGIGRQREGAETAVQFPFYFNFERNVTHIRISPLTMYEMINQMTKY